ncbi:hypothetical protein VP01_2577g2 [Puccinia sorghi]|uniref:VWFA domain-containing protein n=1 Tax=Puccinia sorghi TaxID=27349 RepID=A0A0L6V6Q1_9BASI|nr:hypothetical protein VP01_2577g2 [Puccinia sorghi]
MPPAAARAIPNYVFLPGGTHPIHTQPNYDVRNDIMRRPQRSQDDNLNRTTRPSVQNTSLPSRKSRDNLFLGSFNSARNCLNSLGYLNLPQPILSGINQISTSLNCNQKYTVTNPSAHRYPKQRPALISASDNAPVRRASSTRKENLLATLGRYHTILLVDDSASMSLNGLWKEARDALSVVTAAAVQYTQEGVDIYFLNTNTHLRNARTAREVTQLFSEVVPNGACTPIEVRIEALVSHHLDKQESLRVQGLPPTKPLNLVVITDGVTDDPETLIQTILNIVSRLEEGNFPLKEVGIQFIQIGCSSFLLMTFTNPCRGMFREATRLLRTLDNDLKRIYGIRRDIVDTGSYQLRKLICMLQDTTPYKGKLTGDFVLKSLLGGINKVGRNSFIYSSSSYMDLIQDTTGRLRPIFIF